MIDPRSLGAVLAVLFDELLGWLARKAIGKAIDKATDVHIN